MLFGFGADSSPPASPSKSVAWSNRESSVGRMSTASASRNSPTASVTSHAMSTATTGIKTRQIRDLKLEVELREHRIGELEELYEETQRKASFVQGDLQCRLDEQTVCISAMRREQQRLQSTIAEQSEQVTGLKNAMNQYEEMTNAFRQMMERCSQLEQFQRETEAKARAEAERQQQLAKEAIAKAEEAKALAQAEAAARALAEAKAQEESHRRAQLEAELNALKTSAEQNTTREEIAPTNIPRSPQKLPESATRLIAASQADARGAQMMSEINVLRALQTCTVAGDVQSDTHVKPPARNPADARGMPGTTSRNSRKAAQPKRSGSSAGCTVM